MWIATVFYCLLLITISLSKPLPIDKQTTPDDEDDFYRVLKDAFDQYLQDNLEHNQETSSDGESEVEAETVNGSPEVETKLKRDSSGAEMRSQRNQKEMFEQSGLSLLYPCDRYDTATRTCVNVRQIGTTLTLGVKVPYKEKNAQYRIRWFRYFKRRNSASDLMEELTKDKSPWNINIGGSNLELRISPITETDFSYNYFVATLESIAANIAYNKQREKSLNKQFIKFSIEPINIDMGTLYAGEELVIYARAFMELPIDSVVLEWSLSDIIFQTRYDLPSNMKVNADGSSVIVKELRTSVDKVLTCSVYSNRNVFLARRNFLFKKLGGQDSNNQNSLSSNSNPYYKRRRKRSYEENEGFLENEHVQNTLNYMPNRQNYYSSQNKKYYIDQNSNPFSIYQDHGLRESYISSQYSTHLPVDSSLFYDNEVSSYNDHRSPIRRLKKDTYPENNQQDLESNQHFSDNVRNEWPEKNLRYDNAYDYIEINSDDNLSNKKFLTEQLSREKSSNMKQDSEYVPKQFQNNQASQLDNLIRKTNTLWHEPKENNSNLNNLPESESGEIESFDDMESMIIADCKKNSECSIHAKCLKRANGNHFCRCSPLYRGNGIFCWLI